MTTSDHNLANAVELGCLGSLIPMFQDPTVEKASRVAALEIIEAVARDDSDALALPDSEEARRRPASPPHAGRAPGHQPPPATPSPFSKARRSPPPTACSGSCWTRQSRGN